MDLPSTFYYTTRRKRLSTVTTFYPSTSTLSHMDTNTSPSLHISLSHSHSPYTHHTPPTPPHSTSTSSLMMILHMLLMSYDLISISTPHTIPHLITTPNQPSHPLSVSLSHSHSNRYHPSPSTFCLSLPLLTSPLTYLTVCLSLVPSHSCYLFLSLHPTVHHCKNKQIRTDYKRWHRKDILALFCPLQNQYQWQQCGFAIPLK